ncbi:uncharacterized protein A1O5_04756 [Cladophialophora psammophila CBS 110553]|uniref:Uncharacterized protein n=1 Tax=Cladophialophora psammophila CBS 110553 TaxID=1182543 RepID=W9WVM3_9EURO|nr:uncharacterized protein A1O5_04756 [Cladophialophora psammophila CBS 110553]EXJ72252.1 hypothetical protein A1O5_04756 [Cladophialophora psammophila CBS 110553]
MNRYRTLPGLGPQKAIASTVCQKCLKKDIYECKSSVQERPYTSRPSRTQQLLNPKLAPKLASDTPNNLLNRAWLTNNWLRLRPDGQNLLRNQKIGVDRQFQTPQIPSQPYRQTSRGLDHGLAHGTATITSSPVVVQVETAREHRLLTSCGNENTGPFPVHTLGRRDLQGESLARTAKAGVIAPSVPLTEVDPAPCAGAATAAGLAVQAWTRARLPSREGPLRQKTTSAMVFVDVGKTTTTMIATHCLRET